jgi:HAD superfamily hydrolase (TIGR01549 family)
MGSAGHLGSAGAVAGILFDMDGVVVHQRLDFPAIKREIWGDTDGYILERMATLHGAALARANAILERHETVAAMDATAMDGALPFLAWIEARGLRRGLVTRNSRKSVEIVLGRLGLRFDAVVTREDAPPKPAPDPVLLACRRIGLQPSEVLFVGDFEFDMLAGRRAGTATVLLRGGTQRTSEHADLTVDSLADLRRALEGSGCEREASEPR